MSVVEPGSTGVNLVARAKDILLQPAATWDVIDTEPATIGDLYRSYVMPLAAIPAVCSLLGMLIFGIGGFGISFRPSPVWLIAQTAVGYALSLGMVYVMALIIEGLAPTFGGTKDRIQAFKLAAYSPTAAWIAGVFGLLPTLAVLALIGGLYSLFILYKGLPKLMKAPEEKATPYFVVVLVCAVVVGVVIASVTGAIASMAGPLHMANRGAVDTVKLPGGASLNIGQLEAASKRAEAAARQMEAGKAVAATNPEILKTYLPASVAGFNRTEVSSSSGGVAGMQGSGAEGSYSKGDANFRLTVSDLGGAGALAGMASAFNVQSSKETASGYEKVGKVGGRMTQESYDRTSRHGEYSVLVADRFMVQATGDGVSIDDLKAAVGAVGIGQLESLAKAG